MVMPWELTRMSMRPCSATTPSITPVSAAGSVTSAQRPIARPPAAASAASTCVTLDAVLPTGTTIAPASCRPSAICRPIPLDPPSTRATLPASENRSECFIAVLRSCNGIASQHVLVDFDTEARRGGRQDASIGEGEAFLNQLAAQRLDTEMRRQVLDEGAVRRVEGEVRRGRDRQARLPAMRDDDAAPRRREIADLLGLDE